MSLPALAAARVAWLADCRRRDLSPRTVAGYDTLTNRLVRTFDPAGHALLDALTLDRARDWIDAAPGLRPASRRTYIRTIRAWSAWCTEEYDLERDPLRRLKAPRVPKTRPGLFTPHQLRTLLDLATPPTAYAITVLAETGMRAGEACALRLDDLVDDAFHVRHAKGDKERWIPLSPLLARATEIYMHDIRPTVARAGDVHLLLTPRRRPWTPSTLHHALARLGRRGGIAGVRCSPHTFRHQFLHDLAMDREHPGQLFSLRDLAGHSTLAMVGSYAGPTEADLRAEMEIHSPLSLAFRLAESRAGGSA